jgi:hypothetical protein
MRTLLDEQLARQLVPHLHGHDRGDCSTTGLGGLKNGELLKRAAGAGFEVFLTSDQNIQFQHNLRDGDCL